MKDLKARLEAAEAQAVQLEEAKAAAAAAQRDLQVHAAPFATHHVIVSTQCDAPETSSRSVFLVSCSKLACITMGSVLRLKVTMQHAWQHSCGNGL